MSGVSISLPTLAIAASLCGALALAGFAGKFARSHRVGWRALPFLATMGGGAAWWLALAGGAGALWFGVEIIAAVFAIASAAALACFFGFDATNAARHRLQVTCCSLCVPLQYAFIVAGRYDLFAVCLPIVATLIIPLLTIAQGETCLLLKCITERFWGVMVCVYFLSHTPALLMLDLPGFAGANAGLIAFLVVLAFASQWLWSLASTPDDSRADDAPSPPTHVLGARPCALAVVASLGTLLSSMTPFSPLVAAAMALLIVASSWLGCFILAAIRGERLMPMDDGRRSWLIAGVAFPDALAFAAPIFFYAVRAWSAW
jgi:phosphatidate cytidylyltransferase